MTDQDTKAIVKDSSLLIEQYVGDDQTEHDERHQATGGGIRDILQSEEKVSIRLSLHKKAAVIAKAIGEAKREWTDKKETSKADTKSKDKVKASDELSSTEVEDDVFKIPQGTAHHQ